MSNTHLSEFDQKREEYENDLFAVEDIELTPMEIRLIIQMRRDMEQRIGTNGSIKLTMKISDSVRKLMSVLDAYQDEKARLQQEAEDAEADELAQQLIDAEEANEVEEDD